MKAPGQLTMSCQSHPRVTDTLVSTYSGHSLYSQGSREQAPPADPPRGPNPTSTNREHTYVHVSRTPSARYSWWLNQLESSSRLIGLPHLPSLGGQILSTPLVRNSMEPYYVTERAPPRGQELVSQPPSAFMVLAAQPETRSGWRLSALEKYH